jgi:parallel beta-helix repeat protein
MKNNFLIAILLIVTNFAYSQNKKKVSPYTIDGKSNITINYIKITSTDQDCLTITNCNNIVIQSSEFGDSKKTGINIYNCKNITINDCFFYYVSTGISVQKSSGIKITNNRFLNMQGPMPRGQYVQFNHVYGEGNIISYNVGESVLGANSDEDLINIFQSNGTPNSPIEVSHNKFKGSGTSTSGGGIIAGDKGGSYEVIEDNILVNPGQYGIAIAGGSHMAIRNNVVYGKQQGFTNIGVYAWNQEGNGKTSDSIEISGNRVNFTNKSGGRNDFWHHKNAGDIKGWETNKSDNTLNENILPQNLLSLPVDERSKIDAEGAKGYIKK